MDNLLITKILINKGSNGPDLWDIAPPPENRYIIIDKDTGEIIDDAQGYGYKTHESARKAMWYKFEGGKKKMDSEKSKAFKFWKT